LLSAQGLPVGAVSGFRWSDGTGRAMEPESPYGIETLISATMSLERHL
jgi:hypothetical protein